MYDDEQQLVGVLGYGARLLQREQPIEREIRAIRDLAVDGLRPGRLLVATSSEPTSSTRIISVVKNGSP